MGDATRALGGRELDGPVASPGAGGAADRLAAIGKRLSLADRGGDPEATYRALTRAGLDGPEADLYAHAHSDLSYLLERLAADAGAGRGDEQWCVMFARRPGDPHRGPMSEDEARAWVREIVEEDGARPEAFYVAHRFVGPWRPVEGGALTP